MTIISSSKDGVLRFHPQDGRRRLPSFTSIITRHRVAYGVQLDGRELQLGLVAETDELMDWDKYEVRFKTYEPVKHGKHKRSK